jgi:hypothetical protein
MLQGPRVAGRGIGKSGAGEALTQIRKFSVRYLQGKGLTGQASTPFAALSSTGAAHSTGARRKRG